jgi:hypothetical protein
VLCPDAASGVAVPEAACATDGAPGVEGAEEAERDCGMEGVCETDGVFGGAGVD